MAELPGEDDVTRVEIEIYAMTAAGGVSKPLTVSASLPTVVRPDEDTWALTSRGVASDGTSQPVLVVSGSVADPAVATVSIQYGLTAEGPWIAEFNGPPPVVEYEIKGLKPTVDYYVLVTYYSIQGVPGKSLVLGPKAAPGLIAGDLSPGSPIVRRIDDILLDVEDLIATYGSTEAAAVSAAAADTARALAEAAKQGAIDAKTESAAQAVASQTARQGSETAAAASVASAQTSSSKADEAGQKAAAAEVARAAAETQRAQAEAARNTAVGAADTATGASASALSSASRSTLRLHSVNLPPSGPCDLRAETLNQLRSPPMS